MGDSESKSKPRALSAAKRGPLSKERLAHSLLLTDAEPFRALLEEMIGARPTPAAVRKWAAENPDKWTQSVATLARLAGYDFKGTVAHEHTHRHLHVHAMSDAELVAELEAMRLPSEAAEGETEGE